MPLFICKFCSSERKNNNSLRNHERTCKLNSDRQLTLFSNPEFQKNKTGKKSNQFIKAKELGLPPPEVTFETRKKISLKSSLYKHTEESKNKISIKLTLAHEQGRAWNIGKSRWNNEPSYPEKFFMKVIENEFLNKNYTREYSIGKYSADFCWIDLKKIIEIDGDQHQRFKEYAERDKRKDNYLMSMGYSILRISWKDMFREPKKYIDIAKKFIETDFSRDPSK